MSPEEVHETVKRSGLRGRGGAGFPTGVKWSLVPRGKDAPHPKYLVANADEMEPGTFKDRLLLEGDPHQLIEGMIVAAYAVQADAAYIFLRWAYREAAVRLSKGDGRGLPGMAIWARTSWRSGYNLEMILHVSAGRYICGEETALLNALEGKRAKPRAKPPYPQTVGLWGKPTVVNNVETLCNVPHIVKHGPDWFQSLSRTEDAGTKLYGASGKVKRPGLWELPMGTTARELLEEHAGGCATGSSSGGRFPGALPPNSSPRRISICRWISTRSEKREAAWARGR
ncbi:MAG: SLBB domain-containing protein [Candidatus Manganitrophus sp.]|nr:MAG: SLBB domain-containing protein [Candidatus Manganitrophus sp.]